MKNIFRRIAGLLKRLSLRVSVYKGSWMSICESVLYLVVISLSKRTFFGQKFEYRLMAKNGRGRWYHLSNVYVVYCVYIYRISRVLTNYDKLSQNVGF